MQTHISMLFFAGDLVYKVKKPVNLGFLDFTTLQSRRHFCHEEVRLNRRLAASVYLGVVEITRDPSGAVRIGGDGTVIDYAVQMRRLPLDRMLDRLIIGGEIDHRTIDEIVGILVAFHRDAATGPGVDEFATPDELRRQVEENLCELDDAAAAPPGPSATLRRHLASWADQFIDENRPLLERRIEAGRIREGHGDLHAGNICLTDRGVVIYDCIEFTPRFRCRDVACELSFLAMDLDSCGRRDLAGHALRRYADVTDDPEIMELAGFYRAHLAAVRSKVELLTARGEAVAEHRRIEAIRRSRQYLNLAVGYTLPPVLILTCGLPATGKSWAARLVAASVQADVLRSDVIRKELAGVAPTARMGAGPGKGIYTPEMSKRTIETMRDRARDVLRSGRAVVADATFLTRAARRPFLDLADELGVRLVILEIASPPEAVIRERLHRRAADEREVSDADLAIYEQMQKEYELPEEVGESRRVVVEYEMTAVDIVERVMEGLVEEGS